MRQRIWCRDCKVWHSRHRMTHCRKGVCERTPCPYSKQGVAK